jgi:hypothetical protein
MSIAPETSILILAVLERGRLPIIPVRVSSNPVILSRINAKNVDIDGLKKNAKKIRPAIRIIPDSGTAKRFVIRK